MSMMLTPRETTAMLNITANELRDLRRRNRLAYIKVGYRTIRYARQDIEAFMNRNRVSAIGEPVK